MLTNEEKMRLIVDEKYLLAEKYDPEWMYENKMGCQCLWLAESLSRVMELKPGMRVLVNKANIAHKAPGHLNDDGTLSVYWGSENLRTGYCPCGIIKKLPTGAEIPKTFCGCCGGHIRANYQRSLGVKLRLKEIVSSSSGSNVKNRCEFLYEVSK